MSKKLLDTSNENKKRSLPSPHHEGKKTPLKSTENVEKPRRYGTNAMNYLKYNGQIIVERDFMKIAEHCRDMIEEVEKNKDKKTPIAFDMEWPWNPVTGSKKTALIQFCLNVDVCYLFQVYTLQRLPNSLINLMQHDNVILNGNCIINDIRKLIRDFPKNQIDTDKLIGNCVDLGRFCNRVFGNKNPWSLANLTKFFLKYDMNKDKSIRAGRWETTFLTKDQQQYAAIDVYASQSIYKIIESHEEKQKQAVKASKVQVKTKTFDEFLRCAQAGPSQATIVANDSDKLRNVIDLTNDEEEKTAQETPRKKMKQEDSGVDFFEELNDGNDLMLAIVGAQIEKRLSEMSNATNA